MLSDKQLTRDGINFILTVFFSDMNEEQKVKILMGGVINGKSNDNFSTDDGKTTDK